MVRSRTRKLRPRAPVFPFASTLSNETKKENTTEEEELPMSLPKTPEHRSFDEEDTNTIKNIINTLSNSTTTETAPVETAPAETAPKQKVESMNHHDSMCFLKIIGNIQNG
jgi:hypothetical protein